MSYEKPFMNIDVLNNEDIVKCSNNLGVEKDPNNGESYLPMV